jgi:uncharacterized protein
MDLSIQIQLFSTRFLGVFIEAGAFLLLGTVISGLIEIFIRQEDIMRLLPKRKIPAIFAGAFLGFLFPVCECGVIPVTRRLYQKGLPVAVGITFLLAAPVMNPIVLASTFSAFGLGPILIGRYVITVIIAVAVGFLFLSQNNPAKVLNADSIAALARNALPGGKPLPVNAYGRPLFWPGVWRALHLAADEFFDIGRYLVFGCALAAGLQTFANREAINALATDPVLSVAALAGLAFVMSVCSTTDAIIALSFANPINGFTTGSLLTFLTFGPMVDIKSTLMYLSVFKRRPVLYIMVVPLLISVLIGIWLNLNIRF